MTDTTPAAIEALLQGAEWQEPESLRRYLFPTFSALASERDAARQERDQALLREAALLANNEAERKTLVAHNARHAAEAAALRKEVEQLREAFSDPIAVHANMLRGAITMPSVENIIHIYGAEALRATITSKGGEG